MGRRGGEISKRLGSHGKELGPYLDGSRDLWQALEQRSDLALNIGHF